MEFTRSQCSKTQSMQMRKMYAILLRRWKIFVKTEMKKKKRQRIVQLTEAKQSSDEEEERNCLSVWLKVGFRTKCICHLDDCRHHQKHGATTTASSHSDSSTIASDQFRCKSFAVDFFQRHLHNSSSSAIQLTQPRSFRSTVLSFIMWHAEVSSNNRKMISISNELDEQRYHRQSLCRVQWIQVHFQYLLFHFCDALSQRLCLPISL